MSCNYTTKTGTHCGVKKLYYGSHCQRHCKLKSIYKDAYGFESFEELEKKVQLQAAIKKPQPKISVDDLSKKKEPTKNVIKEKIAKTFESEDPESAFMDSLREHEDLNEEVEEPKDEINMQDTDHVETLDTEDVIQEPKAEPKMRVSSEQLIRLAYFKLVEIGENADPTRFRGVLQAATKCEDVDRALTDIAEEYSSMLDQYFEDPSVRLLAITGILFASQATNNSLNSKVKYVPKSSDADL